jgi:hypothetical protein
MAGSCSIQSQKRAALRCQHAGASWASRVCERFVRPCARGHRKLAKRLRSGLSARFRRAQTRSSMADFRRRGQRRAITSGNVRPRSAPRVCKSWHFQGRWPIPRLLARIALEASRARERSPRPYAREDGRVWARLLTHRDVDSTVSIKR